MNLDVRKAHIPATRLWGRSFIGYKALQCAHISEADRILEAAVDRERPSQRKAETPKELGGRMVRREQRRRWEFNTMYSRRVLSYQLGRSFEEGAFL